MQKILDMAYGLAIIQLYQHNTGANAMYTLNIYTKTTRPADAELVGIVSRNTEAECIAYAAQHWATYNWEFDGVNRAPLNIVKLSQA